MINIDAMDNIKRSIIVLVVMAIVTLLCGHLELEKQLVNLRVVKKKLQQDQSIKQEILLKLWWEKMKRRQLD